MTDPRMRVQARVTLATLEVAQETIADSLFMLPARSRFIRRESGVWAKVETRKGAKNEMQVLGCKTQVWSC